MYDIPSKTPNRASRRSTKSSIRRKGYLEYKHKGLQMFQMRADQSRVDMQKKISATVKRRELRDIARKEIAKKHGVNWKRVILHGKIIEGEVVSYVIKKDKNGVGNTVSL